MSNPLSFFVPGEPRGKGRPRFARAGRFVRTYTPAETASYESAIRLFFKTAYPDAAPIDGPVMLNVVAVFGVPKSASKAKAVRMREGWIRPTRKPDADNTCKAVLDALQGGVAINDDAQVVSLHVEKRYGERPGLHIEIEPATRADNTSKEV